METLSPPGIAVAVVLGLLLVVGNALAITATRLAATGRMDRASMGGIRTPTTRFSDAAWLGAHQAALPWVLVCNGAGAALGAAGMFLGTTVTPFLYVMSAAVLFTLVGAVSQLIVGERAASRIVAADRDD